MSSRLDKAIKDFIQIIREAGNKGTSPLDAQAEVLRIDEDGTAWVHLPGGVDETPVKLTINAEVGDKVYVRLSGGRAWITGNQTAPPTDDKTAITAKSLANIAGNQAKTAQKTADKAQIVADSALKGAKENAAQMAQMVLDFNGDIKNLQDQIDGNIATWFYDVDPAMSLPPVTDWDTDEKKDAHLGDIYYNTVKGYAWRFMKSGSTYSWERITDTDVTKALADAAKAQDTADSKRRVFYNTPTVPYDAGDLWVQGSGGDILRCAQAKTSAGSYDRSDWVLASKYTDDSALTTWIEGDFATTIQGLEEGLVDAKVETYYQTTDPSTGWSDTQKSEHKGDLWYNSTASVQKYYRWSGTAWQELTATPPQAVFDSIDKKATIYTGTTTPTNPDSGDLWFKGADEPILTYVNNSWVEYNKYTDDSAANNAQTTANEAKAKAEAAQTAVSTKVETSVFNTLKNTVDENSANITSLTETVTTKADSSTVTTLSNTVNEVKQTADANSSSISNLTTTVNSKADGSKVTALENKTSTIEQNLSGVTTRVNNLESENDGLDTRLTAAESKITDDAIVSTVTSSKTYKDALSGKVDTSVYNTKMEQLDNSISLKATATDVYTKTQADAALSTAKSEAISSAKSYTDTATTDMATKEYVTSQGYLTVTSDAITSKVSKNEVISAINQTAESVSINAEKISLTGAVTFSSFDNSLQTTINNKAETSDLEGVRTIANNAQTSIDNLEIGGRNLILKSNTPVESTSYLIKEYTLSEDWNADLLNDRGYILTLKGSINNGQKFGVWLNGASNQAGYMTYDSEKDLYYVKPYLPTSTPITEGYKRAIQIYNYPSGTATNANIEWVKLEKGNKATDWTPAPEDVDEGINSAQETADSIASNIYVPDSTLIDGSKINNGSLSIDQMDDTVAGTYSDPTTKKGIMEWNGDALHIKSIDANAQNTYETVIGGDGIKFNWNGAETASINQDELRINKTVVINAMEVGNWSWAIHPTTGNLMVKWNGGDS